MLGRSAVLVVVVLTGCVFEADLGSQIGAGGDDGTPVDPGDPPGSFAMIHPAGARSILRDGAWLYLTSEAPSAVIRIDGAGTTEVLSPDHHGRMAQDATTLYVADPRSESIVAIDKATLDVSTVTGGWSHVEDIEVDADSIYVGRIDHGPSTGQVLRVDRSSGHVEIIADGLEAPWGLEVDPHFVFVADDIGGRVYAIPQVGCAPIVLASGLNRPSDVLVVDDWIYFTQRGNTYTDGAISRVNRPTAPCGNGDIYTAETLVTGLGHPSWLAVDDIHVYWTGYFSGLQRAPLAGGAAETLLGCGGGGWELTEAPEQGCGAILLDGGRALFSARTPENGSATYAVEK